MFSKVNKLVQSKGLKMKIVKKWVTQLIFFNENKTGRV